MEERNPSEKSPIPDDLTSKILLRLPADSVARFRCASKHWLSLTIGPDFTKIHSSISPIPISSFYWCNDRHQAEPFHLNGNNQSSSSFDPSLSLDFKDFSAELAHSCNGLILCYLPKKVVDKGQPFLFPVSNPATREHDIIPFSMIQRISSSASHLIPSYLHTSKLLHSDIVIVKKSMSCTFSLPQPDYGSDNNIWDYVSNLRFHRSVFWKGSLCWFAFGCVVCLVMETEKYNPESLPWIPSIETSCIGESGGRLHCVIKSKNSYYEIFEMESRSSRWFRLYHIDVDDAMLHLCPEVRVNQYLPLMFFGLFMVERMDLETVYR